MAETVECPICGSEAEWEHTVELEKLNCSDPKHGRFNVTGTVWESAIAKRSPAEWERAFERAKGRAKDGETALGAQFGGAVARRPLRLPRYAYPTEA
jgi:hypothetical protein